MIALDVWVSCICLLDTCLSLATAVSVVFVGVTVLCGFQTAKQKRSNAGRREDRSNQRARSQIQNFGVVPRKFAGKFMMINKGGILLELQSKFNRSKIKAFRNVKCKYIISSAI